MLFPGQTSAPDLGLGPVEAWLIAGILHLLFAVAAVPTRSGGARGRPGIRTDDRAARTRVRVDFSGRMNR